MTHLGGSHNPGNDSLNNMTGGNYKLRKRNFSFYQNPYSSSITVSLRGLNPEKHDIETYTHTHKETLKYILHAYLA